MPEWKKHVDVSQWFHDDALSVADKAKAITDHLRPLIGDDEDAAELLDELAHQDDADEFDYVWNDLYDWADANRVWINTIVSMRRVEHQVAD